MKYKLDTKVKTKRELTVFVTDEETGTEYEQIIPEGSEGVINSTGYSSKYDFKQMYDVMFKFNDEEVEVTFFEEDLETECYIEPNGGQ
jgi:hypothetical protein